MDMLSGKQILIPIAALLLLAVFNLIADPSFYKITLDVNSSGNHVLSGYLITILDYGSELAIPPPNRMANKPSHPVICASTPGSTSVLIPIKSKTNNRKTCRVEILLLSENMNYFPPLFRSRRRTRWFLFA